MELVQSMLAALDFGAEPIGSSLKVLGGLYACKHAVALGRAQLKALAEKLKK